MNILCKTLGHHYEIESFQSWQSRIGKHADVETELVATMRTPLLSECIRCNKKALATNDDNLWRIIWVQFSLIVIETVLIFTLLMFK